MKNIEIKAKCDDPDKAHKILLDLKADFKGVDLQRDSYFRVESGRLKLREGNIENALIAYKREDKKDAKQSNFKIYRSSDPQSLKIMLSESLGILVCVVKTRKIFYIDHVKFHIDQVEGLGSFVEIEVTDMEDKRDVKSMQDTCAYYMRMLNIKTEDLQSLSYSDLLINAGF